MSAVEPEELAREWLTLAAGDLELPDDFAPQLVRSYGKRRRKVALIAAIPAAALVAGGTTLGALSSHSAPPSRQVFDLANVPVRVPPGTTVTSTGGTCKQLSVQLPGTFGATRGPNSFPLTVYSLVSPSGSGCLSGIVTAPYGVASTVQPTDPNVPEDAQPTMVGPFPAHELTYSGGETVYYVPFATRNGGYRDLIAGSEGLAPNETKGLIETAITNETHSTTTSTGSQRQASSSAALPTEGS